MAWYSRVIVCWVEITLTSLKSAWILSRVSAILTRGEDCEVSQGRVCEGLSRLVCLIVRGTLVPKVVREWSKFGSEFRSELELELEGEPADIFKVVVSEDSISVGGFEPGGISRQGGGKMRGFSRGIYLSFLQK